MFIVATGTSCIASAESEEAAGHQEKAVPLGYATGLGQDELVRINPFSRHAKRIRFSLGGTCRRV
jgi:hypothetical protein